jgi:hypothetical protein
MLKLPEERSLQLAACMIRSFVAFEYLVQSFKQEGPELVQRAVVPYAACGVCGIVVIRTNDLGPIQLILHE